MTKDFDEDDHDDDKNKRQGGGGGDDASQDQRDGKGYRLSTSVGGTLTGKGGNLIVLDDPLKPADAYSDTIRHRCQEWFVNTLISRLDDPRSGIIVLVSQRVHVDDLTGFLLEKDEGWKHLELPAIATKNQTMRLGPGLKHIRKPGELLHPERIGHKELEAIRNTVGSHVFEAQYQQNPALPGGTFIKLKWFKRYAARPPLHQFSMIVQSWDTAVETGENNDFSVCTTWGVTSSGYYLIHVFRKRLLHPDLRRAVLSLRKKFKSSFVVIEAANSGKALYHDLGGDRNSWIGSMSPGEDKVSRVIQVMSRIERGMVFLPETGTWLSQFEKEVTEFPFGKFDDQVDSLTQFLRFTNTTTFAYCMTDQYGFSVPDREMRGQRI